MPLTEERMQVLKMVESGAISADEGARLLAAMEGTPRGEGEVRETSGDPRWIRIVVKDLGNGAPKVNVRLPIALVGVGVKMGARFVPGTQGVQIAELIEAVRQDMRGKITEVEDLENDEVVEIYLE